MFCALGTAAGLVFLLACPLVMIGMMLMVFLVAPRLRRDGKGCAMWGPRTHAAGRDERQQP